MKPYLTPFILFFSFLLNAQVQIGNDIDGEAMGDQSGFSISLSGDGRIIAIGAIGNDGNGALSGHVRVYENLSGTWTQIGSDIDGEAIFDQSGRSVSLSSDGSIVAIGAGGNDGNGALSGHVRIYENLNGTWTQIGSDIDGETAEDLSGLSVSLSGDGSIVAIGAPDNQGNGINSGHVRIYENLNEIWTQIGSDIDGEATEDKLPNSISLSSDGRIVAIGASNNDGNGNFSGHVRVYENLSGTWTQIGSDIDGEGVGDQSGRSVSLSDDGRIIAIGALFNNGNNGFNSGHVRVYENLSGIWTQIGNDIDGEATDDFSGISVSLSSDGRIVAIGAPFNQGNGFNSGHTRIYENLSGTWTQIGNDIDGEAANDNSGFSVSLSSDGSVVAIGADFNDGNGDNSGHVRVYNLNTVLSTDSFKRDYFNIFPNPANDKIQIKLNSGKNLKCVNIYTVEGKYLYSERKLEINTNRLQSGIYILEIETNQGKSSKKIVIE